MANEHPLDKIVGKTIVATDLDADEVTLSFTDGTSVKLTSHDVQGASWLEVEDVVP